MNSNEITVQPTTTVVADTTDYKAKCLEYLSSMGNKLPNKHQTQFLELASAFKLNPFKREIYAVGYGENWNIITGYEVYIKRAERTGNLDGWEVTVDGSGENMTATVTIYRKDWTHPFKHTVLFSEVCQKTREGKLNSVWAKMPSFMCKKVAIAQGFRLCFSDELSGMPYTSDELAEPEEPKVRDITPKAEPLPKPKTEPKKAEKKYTPEQANEIKNIVECLDSAGLVVFDEEEKARYRQMLIDGEFVKAKAEATKIRDERCKPIEADAEVYDSNAELDKIAEGLF